MVQIMELDFHDLKIDSMQEGIEKVVEAILKPNMRIGLGAGKSINLLVKWLQTCVDNSNFCNLIICCTQKNHVNSLVKAGLKAHCGIPEEAALEGKSWTIDYFFDDIETMDKHFFFLASGKTCRNRMEIYERADQPIFFYTYKNGNRFSQITKIPVEISKKHLYFLNKWFSVEDNRFVTKTNPDKNGLIQAVWHVGSFERNCLENQDQRVEKVLKGIHGMVAYGLLQTRTGYVVEIHNTGNELLMSSTHLGNIPHA